MNRVHWRGTARFNFYGFEYGMSYDQFVKRAAWLLGIPARSLPLFLDVPQVAKIMDESEDFVLDCIKSGAIVADRVNGRWLVCRDLMFPRGPAPTGVPAIKE